MNGGFFSRIIFSNLSPFALCFVEKLRSSFHTISRLEKTYAICQKRLLLSIVAHYHSAFCEKVS